MDALHCVTGVPLRFGGGGTRAGREDLALVDTCPVLAG